MKLSFCFTCDSATIKATFKNKKTGKTYKSKISIKVTVEAKKAAFAVETKELSLLMGDKDKIVYTGEATFKSDNEKVATVDAKTGEVTAVAVGKANITVTSADEKSTATVAVSVARTALQSVAQESTTTIVATIKGATDKIAAKEVLVKNLANNVVYSVEKVTVDATDKTKVTIKTFMEMKDGKEYAVTIDEVTKQFTATDAKVASITFDKATIPADTETTVKVVTKDVNGVILQSLKLSETAAANIDASIKSTAANYYQNGDVINLKKVGDVATAKATWKSGKFDATGKPEGNIESGDFTITAVDPAVVNNFDVRIGASGKSYDKVKANTSVVMGTTGNTAYFKIKDANGAEANYANYEYESSNTGILTLASATGAASKLVTPINEGTAYILIKKASDKTVVASIEITVKAAADIASLSIDKANVTLSNALADTADVTVKQLDQYGSEIVKAISCDIQFVSNNNNATDTLAAVKLNSANKYFTKAADNKKVTFNGQSVAAGTYTYTITAKDNKGTAYSQTVVVTVKAPSADAVSTPVIEVANGASDVKVTSGAAAKTITIKLAEVKGDAKNGYLSTGNTVKKTLANGTIGTTTISTIGYTIKRADGKVLFDSIGTAIQDTAFGSISATGTDDVTITALDPDGSVYKKLLTGTYTVESKVTFTDGTFYSPVPASFTVNDTQATGEMVQRKNALKISDAGTVKAVAEQALSFTISENDEDYKINVEGSTQVYGTTVVITAVDGLASDGTAIAVGKSTTGLNSVTIKKVTMEVIVPGCNTEKITIVKDLGTGFTVALS